MWVCSYRAVCSSGKSASGWFRSIRLRHTKFVLEYLSEKSWIYISKNLPTVPTITDSFVLYFDIHFLILLIAKHLSKPPESTMPEPFFTKIRRWGFNLFPAYRRTGARLTYLDSDWRRVDIKLPLNWRTKNYVGTMFGGCMFAAVDPIYMILLIKRLGNDYVVWDKSASIQFHRPGKTDLFASCELPDEEVAALRQRLETEVSIERTYRTELKNQDDEVCATVEKVIHIRKSKE
ncbi:MAG: hypothetical protein MAGBODY4_00472 [Candidatus Marinimicrobia bacterium]|nr:hypothetical protein [Candidatus Neomarinimicrobiota bacterium]